LGRAGCALVVLASILAGTYSLMERRRLKEPWKDDIYDDLVACTSFYREQLKRFDSLWIYLSFFPCCALGESMYDSTSYGYGVFEVVCSWILVGMLLFVLLVMQQRKQNNQRRIEEIDELLAERDGLG
jgi:undecaprenyl pyrophosphate phosphatase UppP